jgi:hypothetical protein
VEVIADFDISLDFDIRLRQAKSEICSGTFLKMCRSAYEPSFGQVSNEQGWLPCPYLHESYGALYDSKLQDCGQAAIGIVEEKE